LGPTELLRDDHLRLRDLLARGAAAEGAERVSLARTMAAELRTHVRLEEDVLYPALLRLRQDPARSAVRAALAQHQALDGLLAELEALESDDARFGDRLAAIRHAFEAHAGHEEGAVFPEAEAHLAPPRLQKLAALIRARMRQAASLAHRSLEKT
jgi:hemerythrin superfamily protein